MQSPTPPEQTAPRPRLLVAVVGTGTEVGKTWVCARVIERLRHGGSTGRAGNGDPGGARPGCPGSTGHGDSTPTSTNAGRVTVSVRKPLQSQDPASAEPTDAEVLAAASGESPETVCAPDRSFAAAMAPPMAADLLGLNIPTTADLIGGLGWAEGTQVGIVETVGGVRSPLGADGDSRDLVFALGADVTVLVADAELGVIDAVRKSADSLAPITPLVFLNRFDPHDDLHRRNRAWLTERDGLDVLVHAHELADRLRKTIMRA